MEITITRQDVSPEELTKAWLLRSMEDASLSEIEALEVERVVQELPDLLGELVTALSAEEPGFDAASWVERFAELRGASGDAGLRLGEDIALAQQLIAEALRRRLRESEPERYADRVERLATIVASIHAHALRQVASVRAEQMQSLSSIDEASGLYNTRYLQQHIHHLLAAQRRYGHPFAVLVLDVDGLGLVEETRGGAAGGRTLKAVAAAINASVREADTPARLGGDAFCVVTAQQTAERARVLAERVTASIEAVEAPGGAGMRVAVGIASCPQHATEAETLLELADAAMYRAKAAGEKLSVAA